MVNGWHYTVDINILKSDMQWGPEEIYHLKNSPDRGCIKIVLKILKKMDVIGVIDSVALIWLDNDHFQY